MAVIPNANQLAQTDRPTSLPRIEIRSHQIKRQQEVHHLTAVDRTNPAEPTIELRVELWNRNEGCEAILILMTNNDRFAFICDVVGQELPDYSVRGVIDAPHPDRQVQFDRLAA